MYHIKILTLTDSAIVNCRSVNCCADSIFHLPSTQQFTIYNCRVC